MAIPKNHDAGDSPAPDASDRRTSEEPVRWSGFPSWKHFIWLYMFSVLAGTRGFIVLRSEASGWEFWFGGAALLLVCVAALRRWARYILTPHRLIVRNGYTDREIEALPIDRIMDVTIERGPIACFFDIGNVVLKKNTGESDLVLRGVAEPEVLKRRINALRPRSKERVE